MEINSEFAVLLPVHKLATPEQEALFVKALSSTLMQKGVLAAHVAVVVPLAEAEAVRQVAARAVPAPEGVTVDFIVRHPLKDERQAANFNFQAQVNAGVKLLPSGVKYFTILEFDDELRPTYFQRAQAYAQAYPETALFLPIVEDVNAEGTFVKYVNEVLWTPNFTDNLGLLGHEALKGYANFHLPGALIRRDQFVALGGLKESIELVFNYEFLLRLTHRDLTVRSIPRVLYTHLDGRPGSLFQTLTEGRTSLTDEEVRFWFDVAHRECVFTEDRQPTYQPASAALAQ